MDLSSSNDYVHGFVFQRQYVHATRAAAFASTISHIMHHHHPQYSLHHPHHGPLHHHTTSAPEHEPALGLEAANIAHFDALGHDFDKQHPFAAEFADRLARTLLHRHPTTTTTTHTHTQSSGSGGGGGGSSLVLDEDATSVLDFACGSGIYVYAHPPPGPTRDGWHGVWCFTNFWFFI
jgi:hypothetical protein